MALTLTNAKVEELQLQEVLPRRKASRGREPGITTKEVRGPMQEDINWGQSLFSPPMRRSTEEEKKEILALCVEVGLMAAMEGHLYSWHGEVRKQREGLGIGADLTRAVARLVMLDWDQKYLNLVKDNKLTQYSYSRYVDDTANGMVALAPGIR